MTTNLITSQSLSSDLSNRILAIELFLERMCRVRIVEADGVSHESSQVDLNFDREHAARPGPRKSRRGLPYESPCGRFDSLSIEAGT